MRGRFLITGLRRISQLAFLSGFLFLFLHTDYTGSDTIEYAVNILFRLDPFLAAVTMLATRTVIVLMLPALILVVLTLILGRSFCGWVCPLGTLLDGVRHILPTDRLGRETSFPKLSRILLFSALILALFGFHIAGYIDPFSILVRGMATALYPAFHGATESFFTFTYTSTPDSINLITEPVYQWLRDTIRPAERKFFSLAWFSLVLLGGALGAEGLQKRFFCRNLCPTGALLGLLSARGLLRVGGGDDTCNTCRHCAAICRMGAIDETRNISMSRCNLCLECIPACPRQIINVTPPGMRTLRREPAISRRQFLGIAASGILLPAVRRVHGWEKWDDPLTIRPPGALGEEAFRARCVRCGECLQVCIGNGLQPTLLESGLDGIFTPKLVARTGYCEFTCTLCGQVCPTGAIRTIDLAEKHRFKIGHAFFDKNRCLPYAKDIPCMVCEEHCPTADKAIRFREIEIPGNDGTPTTIKQPYVVDDLCIGCGICEFKCPLPGASAIVVTNAGEQRNPNKSLPHNEDVGGSYG